MAAAKPTLAAPLIGEPEDEVVRGLSAESISPAEERAALAAGSAQRKALEAEPKVLFRVPDEGLFINFNRAFRWNIPPKGDPKRGVGELWKGKDHVYLPASIVEWLAESGRF